MSAGRPNVGSANRALAGSDPELARLTEENERLRRQVAEQSSLWEIAHRDPLTELWNRRTCNERLAEETSRAQREASYRFSVIIVDVNDLKGINDRLGHAAGDQALRWVARFLGHDLRAHDLCCRQGGDEFLLILPGSGEKECRDLIERLRQRWQSKARSEGAISVSIGAASYPAHGSTAEALLAVADAAMYEDKRCPEMTE